MPAGEKCPLNDPRHTTQFKPPPARTSPPAVSRGLEAYPLKLGVTPRIQVRLTASVLQLGIPFNAALQVHTAPRFCAELSSPIVANDAAAPTQLSKTDLCSCQEQGDDSRAKIGHTIRSETHRSGTTDSDAASACAAAQPVPTRAISPRHRRVLPAWALPAWLSEMVCYPP
jgi:hypothetical protein